MHQNSLRRFTMLFIGNSILLKSKNIINILSPDNCHYFNYIII